MFDLTSSKLLILAIVALIVVGPKDLPALLRTVGKYLGIMRRHANEFRAQLDEAIREAELHELKKEFEQVGQQVKSTMDEGARAIDTGTQESQRSVESAIEETPKPSQAAPEQEAATAPQPTEKTGT